MEPIGIYLAGFVVADKKIDAGFFVLIEARKERRREHGKPM